METLCRITAFVLIVLAVIVMVAILGIFIAFPIKWTWNVTMPHILGLPTITWGKAWCLHFLCGCLIKASYIKTKS